MTKEEALKLLDETPAANQREIDAAFNRLRQEHVRKAQFSTDPNDRDVANRAVGLLQDAYRVLTGNTVPKPSKAHRNRAKTQSTDIPRASLGGAAARHRTPNRKASYSRVDKAKSPRPVRREKSSFLESWIAAAKWWPASVENVVASLICAAMFLVALFVLTATWGCDP